MIDTQANITEKDNIQRYLRFDVVEFDSDPNMAVKCFFSKFLKLWLLCLVSHISRFA